MGALTSKTYSFQYRAWELNKKPLIDPFNYIWKIKLQYKKEVNEIMRILPQGKFCKE